MLQEVAIHCITAGFLKAAAYKVVKKDNAEVKRC